MGYNNPTTDMGWVRRQFERLDRRIDEIVRPGASMLYTTLANLTAAQADLADAQAEIVAQQAQLNTASESKSNTVTYTPGGSPDSQTARTNFDAASVTFTRPTWAGLCNVIAMVTFFGGDSPTAGYTPTVYARIDGTNSPTSQTAQIPAHSEIRLGGVPTGDEGFQTSGSTFVVPFARSFATSSDVTVSLRLTKAFSGAGSGFVAAVTASAFWSVA